MVAMGCMTQSNQSELIGRFPHEHRRPTHARRASMLLRPQHLCSTGNRQKLPEHNPPRHIPSHKFSLFRLFQVKIHPLRMIVIANHEDASPLSVKRGEISSYSKSAYFQGIVSRGLLPEGDYIRDFCSIYLRPTETDITYTASLPASIILYTSLLS